MTHGSLSPIYLERQSKWKKRLVAPVERWLFRKCDRVVVTCAEERKWCEAWGVKGPFEVTDLKRFFKLDAPVERQKRDRCCEPLHVLYLGREHPLKGLCYLAQAIDELNTERVRSPTLSTPNPLALRVVSNHIGAELEADWSWCDVLCLPTLSDNFGLVVAEALERGKRVITTDGAPAWADWKGESLVYLRGYRAANDRQKFDMLKDTLKGLMD